MHINRRYPLMYNVSHINLYYFQVNKSLVLFFQTLYCLCLYFTCSDICIVLCLYLMFLAKKYFTSLSISRSWQAILHAYFFELLFVKQKTKKSLLMPVPIRPFNFSLIRSIFGTVNTIDLIHLTLDILELPNFKFPIVYNSKFEFFFFFNFVYLYF